MYQYNFFLGLACVSNTHVLQAIEFLSRVETLQSHAVHFAIALHDMDLLHLTDSVQSKLCECVWVCECVSVTVCGWGVRMSVYLWMSDNPLEHLQIQLVFHSPKQER